MWEIGVRGENRREPETEKKEMTYKQRLAAEGPVQRWAEKTSKEKEKDA